MSSAPPDELTIFVASSRQSQPVMAAAEEFLNGSGIKVVRWDSKEFRQPKVYLLDRLLQATDEFDYALFVFEPDDIHVGNGALVNVTRDNVIFELGLFMSKLGHSNTFVISPSPWEAGLHILSDLNNYQIYHYTKPDLPRAASAEQKLAAMKEELQPVCNEIRKRMLDDGPRRIRRGPAHVTRLPDKLPELLRTETPAGLRSVKNVALDMAITWYMYLELLRNQATHDLTIEVIMLDGSAAPIITASHETPTAQTAATQEENIKRYCREHAESLRARQINLRIRAYSEIPFVHGFLFNNCKLLVSMINYSDGKMQGTPNPYLELVRPTIPDRDEVAHHFIEAFSSWFDTRWPDCRQIWPDTEG